MKDITKHSDFIGKKPEQRTKENMNIPNSHLIFVEGGSFQMGDEEGLPWEKPVHQVHVSDFYICKYQVTQAQWAKIMKKNPSIVKKEEHPVENISWYKAIEFCNKKSRWDGLVPCYEINKRDKDIANQNKEDEQKWIVKCDFTQNGYRLPTEAEWEFACRGGNDSKGYIFSGFDVLSLVANTAEDNYTSHSVVGRCFGNELGIYNMSGNVYEWCWDWFENYKEGELINPLGPECGAKRVIRGGAWNEDDIFCRVGARNFFNPGRENGMIGLRLVRNP